jgi:hypothetical protein
MIKKPDSCREISHMAFKAIKSIARFLSFEESGFFFQKDMKVEVGLLVKKNSGRGNKRN